MTLGQLIKTVVARFFPNWVGEIAELLVGLIGVDKILRSIMEDHLPHIVGLGSPVYQEVFRKLFLDFQVKEPTRASILIDWWTRVDRRRIMDVQLSLAKVALGTGGVDPKVLVGYSDALSDMQSLADIGPLGPTGDQARMNLAVTLGFMLPSHRKYLDEKLLSPLVAWLSKEWQKIRTKKEDSGEEPRSFVGSLIRVLWLLVKIGFAGLVLMALIVALPVAILATIVLSLTHGPIVLLIGLMIIVVLVGVLAAIGFMVKAARGTQNKNSIQNLTGGDE